MNRCSKASTNAAQVLRQINYHDLFLKLYKQYGRPHLTFAPPSWQPRQAGKIAKLERVQDEATKQIVGVCGEGGGGIYAERCGGGGDQLGRLEQDIAQVSKIIKNIDRVR
jgi:predicted esterase YcpF (UPF0227 family)